jgi:hypothetical protein
MRALQVDVRVKWDGPLATLEPLAYKWLAGNRSASFGLALLNGHPYGLIQTDGSGFVEIVCDDLTAAPGAWHTVRLLYTGTGLTALLDGQPSALSKPVSGVVSRCEQPLRLGAAADKEGRLVSFLSGKLAEVKIGTPEIKPPDTRIPGELNVEDVVRVLPPNRPETFYLSLAQAGLGRVELAFREGEARSRVEFSLQPGGVHAVLTQRQPAWQGRLGKGVHTLRLGAAERIAYTLRVSGAEDVWQNEFTATDRGAGATADYYAWLSTPAPGPADLEIYDCSEGAVLLLCPEGQTVQTVTQTGGIMGDSSVPSGGAQVWRRHSFTAGDSPCGAWFFYPSRINASGDYTLRGNFTVHWRRPPEAVRQQLAQAGALRLYPLHLRGGRTTHQNRRERYTQAAEAGLRFMEALTQKVENGCRIYERWLVDQDAPRVYWGFDGQMLCARTYYQAYQRTGNERFREMALGMARRVVSYQNRDPQALRCGALPYGLIGEKEEVSWGSSSNIQGKILYGLSQLAAWSDDEVLLQALKLNADYYARMQYANGRWPHFVEQRPESVCGYATAWGVAGLLIAYQKLGHAEHLQSAERGLAAFLQGQRPDGSIHCYCNHAGGEKEDDHAIRSSLTMLTPFALAYALTKKEEYRRTLDDLYRFLSSHQDRSGVIRYAETDCVNLIYAENWGPQGFCEAYEATGDGKFLRAAFRLADFFVRVQVQAQDPHFDGAWVGSYNVVKDFPGGNIDDEGNCFDLYTSWGTGPIVYGLQRLLRHIR